MVTVKQKRSPNKGGVHIYQEKHVRGNDCGTVIYCNITALLRGFWNIIILFPPLKPCSTKSLLKTEFQSHINSFENILTVLFLNLIAKFKAFFRQNLGMKGMKNSVI